MKKRLYIALAALFIAILGGLAWVGLRQQESDPIVDGIPLTRWLDNYVGGDRELADRALTKVGTNSIPALLWMLRQRDSPTKRKAMELVQKQHLIKVHFIPAERRNQAAYFAFLKLGARAEAAVPALIEIYEQKISPFSQQATASSLGHIGPAAKSAVPVLIRGMADTNTMVRFETLQALSCFHAELELVVPALTNALSDPVAKVRFVACEALWGLGGAGLPEVAKVRNPGEVLFLKQAVPALVESLSDVDPRVSDMAARALRQIDAEAASKAGVQ